jgi:hypothetical protein
MQSLETDRVGFVPVDAGFAHVETPLTARTLAIADPSAKSVDHEVTEIFPRSYRSRFFFADSSARPLRRRSSQFPTGVDRVAARKAVRYAYDSSTGTLYRFTSSREEHGRREKHRA